MAKLPPASDSKAAPSVCRQLGFTDGVEKVSTDSLEHYTRIFYQPLCREHVKALAALFGWSAPPCDKVRLADSISDSRFLA